MRTKLTKCCFLDVSNFCYVHKENLDSLSYQTSTFVQKETYVVIMWKVYENCIFWKSEVIPSSWWLLREKTHKEKSRNYNKKITIIKEQQSVTALHYIYNSRKYFLFWTKQYLKMKYAKVQKYRKGQNCVRPLVGC